MARLRVKFQQARRGRGATAGPARPFLLRRIGVPERAAADLPAPGKAANRDLRAPKESGVTRRTVKAPIPYRALQALYLFFICSCLSNFYKNKGL
jgi:hypothetical protein